jgi:hypothetical protein
MSGVRRLPARCFARVARGLWAAGSVSGAFAYKIAINSQGNRDKRYQYGHSNEKDGRECHGRATSEIQRAISAAAEAVTE